MGYEVIGGEESVADAILDRFENSSHHIGLKRESLENVVITAFL